MRQYKLILKNNLLHTASEKLSTSELYSYFFIVFSLKNGLSSRDSKRYGIEYDDIFRACKLYGYTKSRQTFFRHVAKIKLLKLILSGVDQSSYVDILHRYSGKDEKPFTAFCYNEIIVALKTFTQHDLKAFIGFEMNKAYLDQKKPFGRLKSKARLEKKVVRLTNRSKFYHAKRVFLELKNQNSNRLIDASDRIKQVMAQNSNHIVKKTVIKEVKKSVRVIDFKNLKLNNHSLNLINWHRKQKRKRPFSRAQFQEHIRQFAFAISKKQITPRNAEGLFFTHLVNRDGPILKESAIVDYQHFLDSGFTKRESDNLETNIGSGVDVIDFKKKAFEQFASIKATEWEKTTAMGRLMNKNPIFKQVMSMSLEIQVKSGIFKHLENEIIKLRETS